MRSLACCLLLAALRYSATQKEGDDSVSTSCIARGLATPSLSSAQVLANAGLWHANTTRRSPGAVLGFVTPWNSRGYANALRWHAKLTHVSPCWHTLRGEAPRVEVGGEPDAAGVEFSSSLAALPPASRPLLLPRFSLELDGRGVGSVLHDPKSLAAAVSSECARRGYDGAVIDGLSSWTSAGVPEEATSRVVRALAAALFTSGRQLVIALPPGTAATTLAGLTGPGGADFAVLMTYDASLSSPPGPNAPMPWLIKHMEASLGAPIGEAAENEACAAGDDMQPASRGGECGGGKGAVGAPSRPAPAQLLLGVNFYGWAFRRDGRPPDAVLGEDVTALLAEGTTLRWDAKAEEHWFSASPPADAPRSGRRIVYYPTPSSLLLRLRLARAAGAGVAVWELGQGHAWLFDLL